MTRFAVLVFVAALTALGGCKKKEEAGGGGGGGDTDRLQGTWAIQAFDEGRPARPGDEEDFKQVRIKFEGDKMTIINDGRDEKFTFALDENANPKAMTLTEVLDGSRPSRASYAGTKRPVTEPAREPDKLLWIYKFEGDTLVVAFTSKSAKERPTDFKAVARKFEPGQPDVLGVAVVTLKKTDAPPPAARPRATTAFRGTKK